MFTDGIGQLLHKLFVQVKWGKNLHLGHFIYQTIVNLGNMRPVILIYIITQAYALGEYVCFIEEKMEKPIIEKPFFSTPEEYRGECELNKMEIINHNDIYMCPRGTKVLKPKCVCGYFRFQDNNISACDEHQADDPDQMTCGVCKSKSKNGTGPCQNGGTVECDNDTDIAKDLKCKCPENFSGRYCEIKTFKVRHECEINENKTVYPNCTNTTKKPCITYGKNSDQSFICFENEESPDTNALVPCSKYKPTEEQENRNEKSRMPVSKASSVEGSIFVILSLLLVKYILYS